MKPHEKIERLEALKAQGHRVLMVGDGLTTPQRLAAAHASVSPSSAADISQTASDAVFQGAHLMPVVELLATARKTRKMAFQNFAVALGYNLVFVPLAMAGFVTPLVAAIAMSTSSILVTLNAIRLQNGEAGAESMTSLTWLIPAALLLGGLGLAGFIWALRSGQFEDS